MILESEILVKLGAGYKYYESLNYTIPKFKDNKGILRVKKDTEILVKIEDLPKGSGIAVTKICDDCGKTLKNISYRTIIKSRDVTDGKDRCKKCARRYIGIKQINNVKYENSLEYHCIETNRLDVLHSYSKNNKRSAKEISKGNRDNLLWKCKDCGEEYNRRIPSKFIEMGCPHCSDGISYPEKFMINVLSFFDIEFVNQKCFIWSESKIYDFYIPSLNIIIETHGKQHYEKSSGHYKRTLREEQTNDKYKYNLAIQNGIPSENYIVIDCRKSDFEFIKNNIINSRLSEIFDLSTVDWSDVKVNSLKSLIKVACELWNSGIKSTVEISNKIKVCQSTVINYLKKGNEAKLCVYNASENRRIYGTINGKKSGKKVFQLSKSGELMNTFDSVRLAENTLKLRNISNVCKERRKLAGGYKWMYEEDYEKYIAEQQIKLA